MHWAQEVQHGPYEGRQLRGAQVMGSGSLRAGRLHNVLLFPSTNTITRPTDEGT